MTRSTSGARASASPLPKALGMPNSAATARARSTQRHAHTRAPPLPLQRQLLSRTAPAAPRARRSLESDGVFGRAGYERAYAARLLGRATACRAQQRERDGDDPRRSQGDARAPGG